MAAEGQRQGGDRRGHDGAGEGVEDLRAPDQRARRRQRKHQGAEAEGEQGAGGRDALLVDAIDQHAAGKLADQGGKGADGQRGAEGGEIPALLCQPDRDERAEAGLDGGGQEVQGVQAEAAQIHISTCGVVAVSWSGVGVRLFHLGAELSAGAMGGGGEAFGGGGPLWHGRGVDGRVEPTAVRFI